MPVTTASVPAAAAVRRDAAWLSTPEHLERLREAREDSRTGRVRRPTEEELDALLEGRGA